MITTDGPAGRGGFTASAVCSVTDSPPTLLICMNRTSRQAPTFTANGRLCVNVLAGDQQLVSASFAGGKEHDERFESGRWAASECGLPMLEGAIASLATRIARTIDVGSHHVMFCEVDEVSLSAAPDSLIYFDRAYCRPAPYASEAAA
ncbi:flavin reductase [Sphingopyxis sp. 550A]